MSNGGEMYAPMPNVRSRSTNKPYVAPENETQQFLANIWCAVLSIDRISISDDFFADLGGSSLLILSVFHAVQERLAADLPMDIYFGEQTIQRQAATLEAAGCKLS